MGTGKHLERISVVLARARNPNNIGAVARAMYDFGLQDLRVVSDYPLPLAEARSAIDAGVVLAGAREFSSVAEAVADCHLVVGTTAGGKRVIEHPLYPLAEAGKRIQGKLATCRVALLFGSEKTGLSREELSHCNWLLTVPMQEHAGARLPSMNLGQAAAVCFYELAREEHFVTPAEEEGMTAGERERLLQLFMRMLEASGYLQSHPSLEESQLRQFIWRMGLTSSDAVMWMGIFRQLLWKIAGSSEK